MLYRLSGYLPNSSPGPSGHPPPGGGNGLFEALKTSLPDGRLVDLIWRYRTDLAYSVGVMPNLSLN